MKQVRSRIIFALLATTFISILALAVQAQTAPDSNKLSRLLKEFLAGASHNDAAVHERFWADDVIYTGSAGRRRGKADIVRDVRAAPAPKPGDPTTIFSAADIRIQQYGNAAIVAFRLVGTTAKNGATEVMNYLNSGTFVKRNGKWQVVNWQSTRMPRDEEGARKEVAAAASSVEASVTLPPELARLLKDYEAAWKAGDAAALSHL